jgi:hypothetical protein
MSLAAEDLSPLLQGQANHFAVCCYDRSGRARPTYAYPESLATLGGVNGSNAVFDILLKAPHRRFNRVQFPPFDTLLSVPLAEYERH